MRSRRLPLPERICRHRLGGAAILAALVIAVASATRVVLLATNWHAVDARPDVLLAAFAERPVAGRRARRVGRVPALVYLALLPQRVFALGCTRRSPRSSSS